MKAVILAGGEGKRLRCVNPDKPKPMASILGRPVMEHITGLLRGHGFCDIITTLRFRPEAIIEHFGDGSDFGVRMEHRVENMPLGTAGSVLACRDFFGGEDFLVISGDAVCDFDLTSLMRYHRQNRAAVTMALYSCGAPLEYGTVLTTPDGRVRSFIEKPDWSHVVTDLVNTGIYVISPSCLPVSYETPLDFAKDLFPAMLKAGKPIFGLRMEGYWCDIGTPEAYYTCNLDALRGNPRLLPASVPESSPKPLPVRRERRQGAQSRITVETENKARLMRFMSEALMEAGAEFDDGLAVKDSRGRVRVRPDEELSRLIIEADGADAKALCAKYERLARGLDGET